MSLTLLLLLFTLLIGVELSSSNLSDVMALSYRGEDSVEAEVELELVEAVLLIDVELKLAVIDAMIDSFNFFFPQSLFSRRCIFREGKKFTYKTDRIVSFSFFSFFCRL